ncbi:4Fe-4S binding protein [Heliobacterium undosum]|uniref:4Fe-4S binding protein n=1 Tax=Heliomicrobium undosum TaxID=121734 RepID=A0A845L0T2_9FIRM|nr:4Fe-4S binding protein [Heliomicrobium undosum]MZP29793.1 4Fe-4S binding protein [Heliomicrobium undosum]
MNKQPLNPQTSPKRNLLQNRWVRALFESAHYPHVFHWITVTVFALIIYVTLFGSTIASKNFGTAATWVLWWPLIPLLFFLFGRFWCAICPFSWLSDLVQKHFGAERPVPWFLKKYGLWIIDAFFLLITWADHIWGVVESPRGSAYLLLIIVAFVIFAGAFWERRAFCRYICFIGGLSGNYSRAGVLELRATPEICRNCATKACYKGSEKAPGCPMFEFPRTMEDNTKCNLCGYCVKNCPNGSLRLPPRIPTQELWFISKPKLEEAFLAIIVMGIVLVQNLTMLSIWPALLQFTEKLLGTTSYPVVFTAIFLVAMAIPAVALYLTSALSGKAASDSVIRNFTRFGYAIIPLDLAAHMGHNFFHLLSEGKAVWYTFLDIFTDVTLPASMAFVSNDTIYVLQMLTLIVGFAGSAYTAYRIARNHYQEQGKTLAALLPHIVFLALILAINVYAFSLPMAHRV